MLLGGFGFSIFAGVKHVNKQEPPPEGPPGQTQERGQSGATPGAWQLLFSHSGVSDFRDPGGYSLPGYPVRDFPGRNTGAQ